MKFVATILTALSASSIALADGFICQTQDGQFTIKAFNKTSPEQGTRNAAVLVISDNTISYGKKTVAVFHAGETLQSSELVYTVKVDHRYNNANRKGELVMGTKIGNMDQVSLAVDFSYARPVEDGAELSGVMTIAKRDGSELEIDLDCVRYLKLN